VAKKGRHRRYIEAREFQRSSTFSVENFDLDAPDPFALPATRSDDDLDEGVDEDVESDSADDDKYAALAAKYADLDDSGSGSSSKADDAGSPGN